MPLQGHQVVLEASQDQIGSIERDTLDTISSKVNQNFKLPGKLYANYPVDATLIIESSEVAQGNGAGINALFANTTIPSFPKTTLNFQTGAIVGGTVIGFTLPSVNLGYAIRMGITLLSSGSIQCVFSLPQTSLSLVANPGTLFVQGIPLGWVDLESTGISTFKTIGSQNDVIENSVNSNIRVHSLIEFLFKTYLESTTIQAKGDLIVGLSSNNASRLPVGPDAYILSADSSQTSGLKWTALGNQFIGTKDLDGNITLDIVPQVYYLWTLKDTNNVLWDIQVDNLGILHTYSGSTNPLSDLFKVTVGAGFADITITVGGVLIAHNPPVGAGLLNDYFYLKAPNNSKWKVTVNSSNVIVTQFVANTLTIVNDLGKSMFTVQQTDANTALVYLNTYSTLPATPPTVTGSFPIAIWDKGTTKALVFWNGTNWVDLTPPPTTSVTQQMLYWTGTGWTTSVLGFTPTTPPTSYQVYKATTLAQGATDIDFVVTVPIDTTASMIHPIVVFRNEQLCYPNANNNPGGGDGDYYIINAGGNLGHVIRFAVAGQPGSDRVLVHGNGIGYR